MRKYRFRLPEPETQPETTSETTTVETSMTGNVRAAVTRPKTARAAPTPAHDVTVHDVPGDVTEDDLELLMEHADVGGENSVNTIRIDRINKTATVSFNNLAGRFLWSLSVNIVVLCTDV